MKREAIAFAALFAGLAGFGLAGSAAAVPLDFHSADPLPYLRLFPHEGDVLVTWQNGISHIDSENLEITDLDTARFFLLPTPVPGSEQFFYFRLDTWPDTLRVVRGREIETMADQIDVGTFAAAGGNLFSPPGGWASTSGRATAPWPAPASFPTSFRIGTCPAPPFARRASTFRAS